MKYLLPLVFLVGCTPTELDFGDDILKFGESEIEKVIKEEQVNQKPSVTVVQKSI